MHLNAMSYDVILRYYRYWRNYHIIMPDGTNQEVILSSVDGDKLIGGGTFKIYTLLFAIMQFAKCYVYFHLYRNVIKTM